MTGREIWLAFVTILVKEMRRYLRIWPQTLVPPVITITLYFVIFGNLIGSRIGQMGGFSYMEFVVPGLIMMAVIQNSYSNVVSSFYGAKFQHSIEELLVSPTPNWVILAGFTLGGVSRGLAVGLTVTLLSMSQALQQGIQNFPGESLDTLAIGVDTYLPSGALLVADNDRETTETLHTNLFRCICPVTGQPDIGSVQISYQGPAIDHESLLRYLVSYRDHQGFHEQSVEKIFVDITALCRPSVLTVYARFNRRGGIDINPYRSTEKGIPEHLRLVRQ